MSRARPKSPLALTASSSKLSFELGANREAQCKMVYEWEDKEGECYRLYVEERKSLDEVMDHFKEQGFAPRYVDAARFAVLMTRTDTDFDLHVLPPIYDRDAD